MERQYQLRVIRRWILLFIFCLAISGLTAIPVDAQLSFLFRFTPNESSLTSWLNRVLSAYREVAANHPFLLYGYDWLAFAHVVLALLFIGPYKNPVRNIWVLQFGLIACLLVIPTAFIAGHFRGIPLGWRLIDCVFGVFGFAVLWICYRKTAQLVCFNTSSN